MPGRLSKGVFLFIELSIALFLDDPEGLNASETALALRVLALDLLMHFLISVRRVTEEILKHKLLNEI